MRFGSARHSYKIKRLALRNTLRTSIKLRCSKVKSRNTVYKSQNTRRIKRSLAIQLHR